jgi:DEAD/DEAH box helicase domain-containing protein
LLEAEGRSSLLGKVRPYRGGYLPSERRAIERQLFSGELLGVVSTSALELGVDIGGLEAAIIVGYPGTMASLWQQAGRAGRRGDPGLAVFLPGPNLLERYLLQHPDYLFGRPYEEALIDPGNPHILLAHLSAAAFEWPLSTDDARFWGGMGLGLAELMAGEGLLTENRVENRWYFAGGGYPAERVSLRGSGGQYSLVVAGRRSGSDNPSADEERTIGTIDAAGACAQVHPGAVYLHAGETFIVTAMDLEKGRVPLAEAEADYFTEAMATTEVEVIQTHRTRAAGPLAICLGEVLVASRVTGYRRRSSGSGEALGIYPLDLPPGRTQTVGIWFGFPPGLAEELAARGLDPAGGLHGLEHLLIGLMPLMVLCDRWDVAGTSTMFHEAARGPAVFIYDAAAGGMGFTERVYEELAGFITRAGEALAGCPCARGCPSCIQSPKCGNLNHPLDKKATKEILAWMENEIKSAEEKA